MFFNENMFVECVCLFYKNSTGLALSSYFPPSSYALLIPVIWWTETVTSPSSQNPSWNIDLKSWLHRNPGWKANKNQRNKTKDSEGFYQDRTPLQFLPLDINAKIPSGVYASVNWTSNKICLLPISFCNIFFKNKLLNLDSHYISLGKEEGFW